MPKSNTWKRYVESLATEMGVPFDQAATRFMKEMEGGVSAMMEEHSRNERRQEALGLALQDLFALDKPAEVRVDEYGVVAHIPWCEGVRLCYSDVVDVGTIFQTENLTFSFDGKHLTIIADSKRGI